MNDPRNCYDYQAVAVAPVEFFRVERLVLASQPAAEPVGEMAGFASAVLGMAGDSAPGAGPVFASVAGVDDGFRRRSRVGDRAFPIGQEAVLFLQRRECTRLEGVVLDVLHAGDGASGLDRAAQPGVRPEAAGLDEAGHRTGVPRHRGRSVLPGAALEFVDERAGLGDCQLIRRRDAELITQQSGQVDSLAVGDGMQGPNLAGRGSARVVATGIAAAVRLLTAAVARAVAVATSLQPRKFVVHGLAAGIERIFDVGVKAVEVRLQ